jgi:hypothetical protein
LERHVEQVTSRLPDESGLTMIHASLNEIYQRLCKLRGNTATDNRPDKGANSLG